MRIMGLDVGSKTVGIAISDPFGWTAQGIEIIRINEAEEKYGLDRVVELAKEYEVSKFVVGLILNASYARATAGMGGALIRCDGAFPK